jgi:hypothetical protein
MIQVMRGPAIHTLLTLLSTDCVSFIAPGNGSR